MITEEFRACPACAYERGFHVFFKRVKGRTKICLICPNCGQSYDIGWITASIKEIKHEPGPIY
ncbi:MAG: hypothetical protein HZC12_02885 [Nitrospirae bacterium]|nr:hypothetical protein [Nitrospirota bacterium]